MVDIELTVILRIACYIDDIPDLVVRIEEAVDSEIIDYDWEEV